jgi:hypothetical protein
MLLCSEMGLHAIQCADPNSDHDWSDLSPMKSELSLLTRRSFLSTSALALGTVAVSDSNFAFADLTKKEAEVAANIPTADTQLKFNPDGSRRPFKGNTIICHLQPQGSTRDAIEQIATDLKRSSLLGKIALLPPESYHMTVYPGVNDQGRDITGWPSDIPKNASIEECNRVITERMRKFRLECQLPLRMKVDEAKTISNPRASTLRMIGADSGEEKKIRQTVTGWSTHSVSAITSTMSTDFTSRWLINSDGSVRQSKMSTGLSSRRTCRLSQPPLRHSSSAIQNSAPFQICSGLISNSCLQPNSVRLS